MSITIHCDGACSGNPGPGGYGVVLKYREHRKELSGGFIKTTNNRMEVLAAIKGLEALKTDNCEVKLISDSKYLVDAVTKGWLKKWQSNRWRNSKNDVVKNIDLWSYLDALITKHKVEFVWIKGHNNIPENERCDQPSTTGSKIIWHMMKYMKQ